MKLTKFYPLLLLITIIISCQYKNPIERNKIVFENDPASVQDSIIVMQSLLDKLSVPPDQKRGRYQVIDNRVYVNGTSYFDNSNRRYVRDGKDAYINMSKDEVSHLKKLALYLASNHLATGYFDFSYERWNFCYRKLYDRGFNDVRDIILVNDNESISAEDRELDHINKLFLIAPYDAIIR